MHLLFSIYSHDPCYLWKKKPSGWLIWGYRTLYWLLRGHWQLLIIKSSHTTCLKTTCTAYYMFPVTSSVPQLPPYKNIDDIKPSQETCSFSANSDSSVRLWMIKKKDKTWVDLGLRSGDLKTQHETIHKSPLISATRFRSSSWIIFIMLSFRLFMLI